MTKEWLMKTIQDYLLMILLCLEGMFLLAALITVVVSLFSAPGWRVFAWFGIVGLVIILAVIAYGIADEVHRLRNR